MSFDVCRLSFDVWEWTPFSVRWAPMFVGNSPFFVRRAPKSENKHLFLSDERLCLLVTRLSLSDERLSLRMNAFFCRLTFYVWEWTPMFVRWVTNCLRWAPIGPVQATEPVIVLPRNVFLGGVRSISIKNRDKRSVSSYAWRIFFYFQLLSSGICFFVLAPNSRIFSTWRIKLSFPSVNRFIEVV